VGPGPLAEGGAQQACFVADQRATGSGVIVDPDGYIVTNAHVVIDARHLDVSVIDGGQSGQRAKHKHLAATPVGLDRETDLAVLKIEAKNLPTSVLPGRFGDSEKGQEPERQAPLVGSTDASNLPQLREFRGIRRTGSSPSISLSGSRLR
jgi:S1-C subfamily serine protease